MPIIYFNIAHYDFKLGLFLNKISTFSYIFCTVVARLSPANVVPEMLAAKLGPVKLSSCQLELSKYQANSSYKLQLESKLIQISKMDEVTRNQIDKLFTKLDLSGCSDWTERQQQAVRDCIIRHHEIFALENKEFGWTDLVKHKIKLDNYVPFTEGYRRIPPHQYE